ncbi:polysaccharide deacetylase family protein, partial [Microbacteriaceae bacterium K1510]|nr:polysaccharide deacetylase family protein [Microbacteriaceae bacterium K1510]
LDALAAQCTKATFFEVGRMIKEFTDVAKQVQAEGHTVGTHTYTHRNLAGASNAQAEQQIESTFNLAQATLPNGVAPFFRFPY